jgi:energy-coupling factor transporter ATP-binding protein EcfA2
MNEASDGSVQSEPRELVARVERLAEGAEQRWGLLAQAQREIGLDPDAPVSPAGARGPRERARELRDHARAFLLPRARDLDAPLLVAIVGPTGSGKSCLLNTLAGAPLSRTGVLRPTTRDVVAVGSAADLARAIDVGALAGLPAEHLERHVAEVLPGLVIVDAPDIDSVEHADRALADHLLEAADLGLFVTTATRYADRVPWDVLARAEQRRLGLIVILNRMPAGEDAEVVLEDVKALLTATELRVRDIISVPDGAISDDRASLTPSAVEPLGRWLATLSADAAERRTLAADALAGALRGVMPLAQAVADDLDQEVQVRKALVDIAGRAYADERATMLERLFSGSFLREEVVRHWHSFVGADQITRYFARGIGQVRGMVAALLRGAPRAPVASVQQGATDDIIALVTSHAAEAARRTSERWSADPDGASLVAAHPELWASSPGLEAATQRAVDAWIEGIAQDVAERGAERRGPARLAALGVNAAAVTLMLVTFTYTGGLTGAEAGIAAATAFLNQKLLNALFGEAAVQEMIGRARRRLSDALEALLAAERQRFEERLGDVAARERLADELRSTAA